MRNIALIPFLFPQPCLLCGSPCLYDSADEVRGAARIPLCRSCHRSFTPIDGRRCDRCSQELTSEQGLCLRCREREFSFDRNWSVFAYEGAAKELLYQYKFRNKGRLAPYLAWWLARSYRERFAGLPLVPVPFRPSGRRKRGWDHVERILFHLRKSYGIPALRLLRRGEGRQQKSLDFEGRMQNLSGKIRLDRAVAHVRRRESASDASDPRGAVRPGPPPAVVLLDDVFTTGATASECARTLREAGIERVSVLTFAID